MAYGYQEIVEKKWGTEHRKKNHEVGNVLVDSAKCISKFRAETRMSVVVSLIQWNDADGARGRNFESLK